MAHMCPDDKLSDLGQVLAQALTNLSYSREASFCGFDIRNASPYVGESTSVASSRLELYISRGNIYQNECRSKI